jgi:hypothetical protein
MTAARGRTLPWTETRPALAEGQRCGLSRTLVSERVVSTFEFPQWGNPRHSSRRHLMAGKRRSRPFAGQRLEPRRSTLSRPTTDTGPDATEDGEQPFNLKGHAGQPCAKSILRSWPKAIPITSHAARRIFFFSVCDIAPNEPTRSDLFDVPRQIGPCRVDLRPGPGDMIARPAPHLVEITEPR